MKLKLLFVLLLFLFVLPFSVTKAYAHPMDITYLDLYIHHDSNDKPIPETIIEANYSMSWTEAAYIFHISATDLPTSDDLSAKDMYANYFKKNIFVYNNDSLCKPTYGDVVKSSQNDIVFGNGVVIPMKFECKDPINNIHIKNTLFIEEFSTQRNTITIYNGKNKMVATTLLTATNNEYTYTDSNTQGNSVAPRLSGLASVISKVTEQYLTKGKQSLPLAIGFVFLLGLLHTLEAGHSKTVLAAYILNKKVSLKQGLSFAGIFTLTHLADILILGVFLLITNSFFNVYATLSQLNVFALYTLFFISLYMVFKNLGEFIRSKIHLKPTHPHSHNDEHNHHHEHTHGKSAAHHHTHEETHSHGDGNHGHTHPWEVYPNDFKKQIMLAFLMGLSPCLFAWSIFMVILSIKQIWVIFPIILSFGLGIFVALSLLVFIVTKFKVKITNKYQWVGEISPIISYLLLTIFAVLAII